MNGEKPEGLVCLSSFVPLQLMPPFFEKAPLVDFCWFLLLPCFTPDADVGIEVDESFAVRPVFPKFAPFSFNLLSKLFFLAPFGSPLCRLLPRASVSSLLFACSFFITRSPSPFSILRAISAGPTPLFSSPTFELLNPCTFVPSALLFFFGLARYWIFFSFSSSISLFRFCLAFSPASTSISSSSSSARVLAHCPCESTANVLISVLSSSSRRAPPHVTQCPSLSRTNSSPSLVETKKQWIDPT